MNNIKRRYSDIDDGVNDTSDSESIIDPGEENNNAPYTESSQSLVSNPLNSEINFYANQEIEQNGIIGPENINSIIDLLGINVLEENRHYIIMHNIRQNWQDINLNQLFVVRVMLRAISVLHNNSMSEMYLSEYSVDNIRNELSNALLNNVYADNNSGIDINQYHDFMFDLTYISIFNYLVDIPDSPLAEFANATQSQLSSFDDFLNTYTIDNLIDIFHEYSAQIGEDNNYRAFFEEFNRNMIEMMIIAHNQIIEMMIIAHNQIIEMMIIAHNQYIETDNPEPNYDPNNFLFDPNSSYSREQ